MNKLVIYVDTEEGSTLGKYDVEELSAADLLLAIAHLTEDCINHYDMDLNEVLKVTEELVTTPVDEPDLMN